MRFWHRDAQFFSRSSKNESLNTSLVGTQLRQLLIEAADILGVAPRNPLRLDLLNVVVLGLPFARNCPTLSPFRFDPASFLEKSDSMTSSNTIVPSRSSPRMANAFLFCTMKVTQSAQRDANAFDAFIEIPLIGPVRDASSKQQSPKIPATRQHLLSCCFRIK